MPKANLFNLALNLSICAFKGLLPSLSQDVSSIIYDRGHINCPLHTCIYYHIYVLVLQRAKDHIHVAHHYMPSASTEKILKYLQRE